jgi:FlaA1/EpsC-like NDP-sugar epimerase
VFHAAALKHLPLLEMWPVEAVKTNVFGTQNLIDAAKRARVAKFINISTDKAANPTSVLGYSKRIAERLTAAAGADPSEAYLSVRFGNVLGSRGSVLTTFRQQIDADGPVTVTHPEVTRYFMTVEEAVQLVIQGGAIGENGEALVLDMGEPVRIDDVARQLVAQATRPVKIVYTGLRSGEKLHEELLGAGEIDQRPHHPLISHVTVPPLAIDEISALLASGDNGGTATNLRLVCEQGTAISPAQTPAAASTFASRS